MNLDLRKDLYFSVEMNKDQALEELSHGVCHFSICTFDYYNSICSIQECIFVNSRQVAITMYMIDMIYIYRRSSSTFLPYFLKKYNEV